MSPFHLVLLLKLYVWPDPFLDYTPAVRQLEALDTALKDLQRWGLAEPWLTVQYRANPEAPLPPLLTANGVVYVADLLNLAPPERKPLCKH
jgi:hypothetical protein